MWPSKGRAENGRVPCGLIEPGKWFLRYASWDGWLFSPSRGASAVPMPTAAPQQAKAWFNADTTQNWDDADDVQAVTEASSGEESQDEAPADEGAKDEDAAEDQTDDADASSSGDWDSGSSGVVKNRTSSEQLIVSDAEKKLQAALHTEVFNPDLSIEASLGYSGIITYTKPVPVEVTLKNSGGDLDGRVCVNLYRTNSVYDRVEYPLYLPAGAEKRIRFYVTLAMKQDIFTVEYRWGDQTVASVNVSPFEDRSAELLSGGRIVVQPGRAQLPEHRLKERPSASRRILSDRAAFCKQFSGYAGRAGRLRHAGGGRRGFDIAQRAAEGRV